MSIIEGTANSGLIELGRDADASPAAEALRATWTNRSMMTLLVLVQASWLGAILYAAFTFI